MYSEEELLAMLREAYGMPYGIAQTTLLERVIQHADAAELDQLAFHARMQATTAYVYGGEPAKSFVTFSWCLNEFDKHRERYDAGDASLLLWHFKYMVSGLTKFPEVPLRRTHDVLDDMERRYRDGGHSLHAVYSHRWLVAQHVGDPSADDWYAKWSAAPRDDNSDCIGCDPTSKVEHLATRGRDEEAVRLAEPVLGGRLTCSEQPQAILTELMLPLLRTGQYEEAADAHRRGYRGMRANLADLSGIATHVGFCALTGNAPRGLEIVQRHLSWLDRSPSPYATMWFAANAALLLRRLTEDGHTGLTLKRAGAEVPIDEVAAELAETATRLGARFDTRNGTTRIGDMVAAQLVAEPIIERLPLNAVDVARMAASAPRIGRHAAPEDKPTWSAPTELPEQPAELLDHAERMLRLQDTEAANRAWAQFDERYLGAEPALAARRLAGRGMQLSVSGALREAEVTFRAAADAHRTAGDEIHALVALSRAEMMALYQADSPEDGAQPLAELLAATARLLELGDAERRAASRVRAAVALAQAERLDDALAELDEASAEPIKDALLRAEIEERRAHFTLMQERHERSATSAAAARRYLGELGDPPLLARVCLLHAYALSNMGDLEGAAEAFGVALRQSSDREIRRSALAGRGRTLLSTGQPIDAINDLVEAVAEFVALGEGPAQTAEIDGGSQAAAGAAAMLRYDLATAYHETGQLLDAAEAAESALDTLDRLGAQDPADRTRYLLSRIYRDMDELEQALALLEQLAENLDGFDNLPTRARMLEEAAMLLFHQDRDAVAAQRFAAAATAYATVGQQLDELRARRWLMLALRYAEDMDESIAALAEADTLAGSLLASLPDAAAEQPSEQVGYAQAVRWEVAMLSYDAARVHIGAGDGEQALQRITPVAAAFREIDAYSEALQADLLHGELLARMDRADEAEPLLRAALTSAPHDSQLRENAAWMLSEVLEAQGRQEEAERLRAEHNLQE